MAGLRTSLYERHVALGGRMVEFAGWQLPLHYGSQINEHHSVRREAGVFDVSHMRITDIAGPDSERYLRRLLTNLVDKLVMPGQALYSCMLNEDAGIIDDVVLYRLATGYRLVSNAGTRERVGAWLQQQASGLDLDLRLRADLAMLAVQGPRALERLLPIFPPQAADSIRSLRRFTACWLDDDRVIARTGYTGEEGVEIMCPADFAVKCWDYCVAAGIAPIGLGARDSLRLEAGMNLYGTDMDETVTPYECGLGWTVDEAPRDPGYVGMDRLRERRNQTEGARQTGVILLGKGVLRSHQAIRVPQLGTGLITSGGYAPSLDRSIALARVPATTPVGYELAVEIRDRAVPALTLKPPFVRLGTVQVALPCLL